MTEREAVLLRKRCASYLARRGYSLYTQKNETQWFDPNANRYAVVPRGSSPADSEYTMRLKDLCYYCGDRYAAMADRYSSLVRTRTA